MSNKQASLPSLLLLAALGLPQSLHAYDSERLQAALESLGPTTVAGWESKAQAGDALAQNVMGMAYKYGIGTEQNHAVSLEWFRKAADQGDADAQFNLGRIYGKAIGTYAKARAAPQDGVEAVKWYRRSAEQDYRPAQFNLAEIYAEGSRDVPRDDVLAYFWMSLAASGGDQAAAQRLERYAAQMTAAQIDNARGLVADWKRRRGSK